MVDGVGTPEDVEVAVIEGVAAEVPVWVMEDVWVTPPVPVRVAAAVCDVVEVEVPAGVPVPVEVRVGDTEGVIVVLPLAVEVNVPDDVMEAVGEVDGIGAVSLRMRSLYRSAKITSPAELSPNPIGLLSVVVVATTPSWVDPLIIIDTGGFPAMV